MYVLEAHHQGFLLEGCGQWVPIRSMAPQAPCRRSDKVMVFAEQSFSNGGPGAEASSSPGNSLKMQNSGPSLRRMNQKVWGEAGQALFSQALQVT